MLQTLCERLCKIYHQAIALAEEEAANKRNRKEAVAAALRLKQSSKIVLLSSNKVEFLKQHMLFVTTDGVDMEEYYPHFLDMVRNLLDG